MSKRVRQKGSRRAPAHSARRPGRWRRAWWVPPCVVVIAVITGYALWSRRPEAGTPPGLPELGEFASFRHDQAPAQELCRRLALPELPDISGLDEAGQRKFFEVLHELRSKPQDPDAFGRLGMLYEAQSFPDLATALYRRALELAPEQHKWHYLLGMRLSYDGEVTAAEETFSRAAGLNPDYPPVWIQRAWLAMDRGELETARRFADRYVALRPNDPFGYVTRAQIHLEAQQWDAMRADLEMAQTLGPIGKQGHRLLGILYQRLGDARESRFHLNMSAERLPGGTMDDPIAGEVTRFRTFRHPRLMTFWSLVGQGRHAQAVKLGASLLEEYKGRQEYGRICGKLSECCRLLGDVDGAYRYAREAREALPLDATPYASLAMALLARGQLQDAVKQADKALAINSDQRRALLARAIARIQIAHRQRDTPAGNVSADPHGVLELAVEDLERCLALRPLDFASLMSLATAQGLMGRYDLAEDTLETALRVAPRSRRANELMRKVRSRESLWSADATQ